MILVLSQCSCKCYVFPFSFCCCCPLMMMRIFILHFIEFVSLKKLYNEWNSSEIRERREHFQKTRFWWKCISWAEWAVPPEWIKKSIRKTFYILKYIQSIYNTYTKWYNKSVQKLWMSFTQTQRQTLSIKRPLIANSFRKFKGRKFQNEYSNYVLHF